MAVSHEVALRDELLRSRDHDIATLTIALREARAEIERLRADNEHLREPLRGDDPPEIDRLRATLTAITKVSRDDWEFRDGEPVPKWWLLASDAIAVEQSVGGNPERDRKDWEASQERAKDAGL